VKLFGAEVRRFLARRAVVLLLVAGFGLSLFIVGAELWNHRPVSAQTLQIAEDRADAEAQQPYVQRDYKRCLERPRRYGGQCENLLPQAEWFLNQQTLQPLESIKTISLPIVVTLGFMVLLAGTSFLGAEFSSGSISNVLLFEPRRWRVWLAKMAATGTLVGAAAILTVVLGYGAITAFGMAWTDVSYTGDQWWALAYRALRAALVVGGATLLGAAVTAALRSTIATVGLVLGYLLVGEALLRAVLFEQTVRWLVSNHVSAFVDGRLKVTHYPADGPPEVVRFHLQESAIYLGVGMAVVLLLSYLVFRRRDIA